MAQTKRKRRTKHRGTPAGAIQSRGRTGRPLSAEERKKQARVDAREKRLNTPPTWKSSSIRAALAGALVFVFILLTQKNHSVVTAVAFTVIAIVFYIPAGYYLELTLFRRRQRKMAAAKGNRR
jgi:Flp pilus assembly protein TadB